MSNLPRSWLGSTHSDIISGSSCVLSAGYKKFETLPEVEGAGLGTAFWAGESREAGVGWLRRETRVEGAAEDMVETLTVESALDSGLAAATGAGLAKGWAVCDWDSSAIILPSARETDCFGRKDGV